MRLAILSDVHANLEALRAVLDHAEAQRPDALLCLGDFVGYGPDPNACVDVLAARVRAAVVGNHDLAALGARPIADFNLWAQEAIVWTQRALTDAARAYLAALPERAEVEGVLLVHGSPRQPADEYILDVRTARASFAADGFRIAVVGHTHQPAVFAATRHRVGAAGLLPEVPLPLEPTHRYIINVGSVGQPRDGDPRAAYVLLDTGRQEVTLFRVAYPVADVQRKMEAAGLPSPLIERLALGR
ncbi:MAG: metallophosphoesterase family protein [Armatimonadota bacterium]|nr:metallophosphoesterase family protein [Armatimonadota bacterium]MDR7534122.1 metallophosphoesterase family protein [Armatimonadota bacterium]MDR7535844.1 metallophosphoesterase family protein [Armatimonadota bacterium]